MKTASALLLWAFVFIPGLCSAQLNFPSVLRDEVTEQQLGGSAREAVVLIHGWTNTNSVPQGYNRYTDTDGSPHLVRLTNLFKQKLAGSSTKLVTYHWEIDAATGSTGEFVFTDFIGYGNATEAAINGYQHGNNLAAMLKQQSPDLRFVHLIAHSAGSWVARKAAEVLLQRNPYLTVQVTLLDPFIPDANYGFTTGLSKEEMNDLANVEESERIYRLENYFAEDLFVPSTQEEFAWRSTIDLNQKVDWGIYYQSHGGPVQFYADTVQASIQGQAVPSGLYGSGCPFVFTDVGVNLSRLLQGFLLPNISAQPISQSVTASATLSLSVTASRATSYEWYKNDVYLGSGSSVLTLNGVTASDAGSYVARVINDDGAVYSDKAVVTIITASLPTITTVAPLIFNAQPSGRTITIGGTNFTALSRLTFDDGVNPPFTNRVPATWTPTQLTYSISSPNPATWTVKVVNGGVESLPYTFYAVSNTAQFTGLSIEGPPTVAESSSGQFNATAFFSDGTTQAVTPSWSENSSATSISSSGQLSTNSVSSDTTVTVSASYSTGGVTKSASTNVIVVNGGSGGGPQTTNVIVNGGFESGLTPWAPSGYADVVNLSYPRSGSWYGYVGNTASVSAGSLAQFFPIPAAATAATLSFYIDIVTAETTTTQKFDKLKVDLATGSDQYVDTIAEFSNLDKGDNVNGTYVLKSYNIISKINNYKGQSLFLIFSGTTDAGNSTIFRVDDVKLDITTPTPVNLTGVSISGPSSIREGQLEAYTARAIFSDGTTQTVSPNSWSENSSTTSIDANGYLTASQVSFDTSVTVSTSYTFNGVTKQATKSVTVVDSSPPVTFTTLAINGPGALNESSTAQFTATAIFSDGSTQTVSPSWSENSSSTTISGGGVLTAGEVSSNRTVTVSASHSINGVSRGATHSVLVVNSATPPTFSSLSINGPSTINEQTTGEFAATATFSDGSTQEVVPTWSENSSATSISIFGLLSAGDISADANVTVSATATIAGIARSGSKNVTIVAQNGPPVITGQPQGTIVSAGQSASFSVTATGLAPLAYLWKRNGQTIADASGSTLTLAAVNAASAGIYTVTVSNTNGATPSQPALLTVRQSSFSNWQAAYFTPEEIAASSSIAALAGDPNHDGISNWLSFAFGIDPRGVAKPGALPAVFIEEFGGQRYLVFAFRKLLGVTNIPYIACVSDDLHSWDESGDEIEQLGNTVPSGDGLTEIVKVRLKTPLSGPQMEKKFLQLRVGSSQTTTTLLEDNFDDNSLDSSKWQIVQNGSTRVVEEGGLMKVETTQTDRAGKLQTQPVVVPMDRNWTLTRRVLLHRDTPYSYQGGTKFFTGYMRFVIDQMQPFGVWYCDYDYAGDSPGRLPKHGFVLAKNGAGGTTNPNTGNVTAEIMPLLLDQWFDEMVSYDPASGLLRYFVNDVLRSEFDVGTPPDASPRTMQIEFEAYGWWTTHWQHFDNLLLKSGE